MGAEAPLDARRCCAAWPEPGRPLVGASWRRGSTHHLLRGDGDPANDRLHERQPALCGPLHGADHREADPHSPQCRPLYRVHPVWIEWLNRGLFGAQPRGGWLPADGAHHRQHRGHLDLAVLLGAGSFCQARSTAQRPKRALAPATPAHSRQRPLPAGTGALSAALVWAAIDAGGGPHLSGAGDASSARTLHLDPAAVSTQCLGRAAAMEPARQSGRPGADTALGCSAVDCRLHPLDTAAALARWRQQHGIGTTSGIDCAGGTWRLHRLFDPLVVAA